MNNSLPLTSEYLPPQGHAAYQQIAALTFSQAFYIDSEWVQWLLCNVDYSLFILLEFCSLGLSNALQRFTIHDQVLLIGQFLKDLGLKLLINEAGSFKNTYKDINCSQNMVKRYRIAKLTYNQEPRPRQTAAMDLSSHICMLQHRLYPRQHPRLQ